MKRFLILMLCITLLLSGCSWLDGEYHSVKPHASDGNKLSDDVVTVSDYIELRDALLEKKQYDHPMFQFAKQFAAADKIVMAAPYWDLAFPALLKIYLEAVTVTGITFRYTEEGRPATLCRAKKLIYVTTAGGPILDFNFGFDYVSMLARGFYEIPEVLCLKAENLDIIGADVPALLAAAKKQAADLLK